VRLRASESRLGKRVNAMRQKIGRQQESICFDIERQQFQGARLNQSVREET